MELGATGAPAKHNKEELNRYLRKLCSGLTLQSNKDGFFNSFVQNVQADWEPGFQHEFSKLPGDLERIKTAWHLPKVQCLKVEKCFTGKSIEISAARRQEGNVAFQEKNDRKALKFYTQAVIRAAPPTQSADGLSLALANRSAVLFHLKEYSQCIQDVTLSLEAFLPVKLHYKVLDRRANCHKQLGLESEALQGYQAALKSVQRSMLDDNKKSSWEKELTDKIKDINENSASINYQVKEKLEVTYDPLFEGQSKILLQASSALKIEHSKDAGRFAVARKDIPAGATLVREIPFSSVLLSDKIGLHCSHCFVRLLAPLPCDTCCLATFCSPSCKSSAMGTYHQWECQFSSLLTGSGMSLNCYLALRIITERSVGYFLEVRKSLEDSNGMPTERDPHRCDDYVAIYNLVALEKMRTPDDYFHRSLMAVFLLKVLISSGYVSNPDGIELSSNAAYIGTLLLRHLQFIQFNAHEVSGMSYQGEKSFKKCKSVYLGLAIYPTVSFFNHSCYPAVGRYFNGKEMTIVSLRPIRKGQPVEENYGPIFTKHNFEERSNKLLSRYWFSCRCEACIGNWPTYSGLDCNEPVFQCPECYQRLATRKKNSSGKRTKEFCIKCNTNVSLEAIKTKVLNAMTTYDDAMSAMEKGNQSEAIELCLKYINDVIHYVTLPNREVHLSLDSLRLLIATKGANYLTTEEIK